MTTRAADVGKFHNTGELLLVNSCQICVANNVDSFAKLYLGRPIHAADCFFTLCTCC